MKKRLFYKLLMFTLIICFGVACLASFSSAITEPENGSLKTVPLAAQDLRLQLVGTVVSNNPDESLAIIEDQTTKKQLLRREGSTVGKAVIKKILRNRVIIEAGQGEVMLTMLHDQPSASPTGVRTQRAVAQPALTIRAPEDPFKPTRISLKDVKPYFADVEQFKSRLQLHPITEGKDQIGVLLRNVRRGGILWRMGLRNRDLIMGVNGTPITSPAEADVLFQTLKKGGEISIEIERRNQPQEILLAIQ